jgi:hypothetical protein
MTLRARYCCLPYFEIAGMTVGASQLRGKTQYGIRSGNSLTDRWQIDPPYCYDVVKDALEN